MSFINNVMQNFDIIKTVSMIYIFYQILYYGYKYNISIRDHINENKEMYKMIKDIHNKISNNMMNKNYD